VETGSARSMYRRRLIHLSAVPFRSVPFARSSRSIGLAGMKIMVADGCHEGDVQSRVLPIPLIYGLRRPEVSEEQGVDSGRRVSRDRMYGLSHPLQQNVCPEPLAY